jgi:uncharacterized membrane protein
MPTFVQWIHLSAAVIGVGGIAFMLVILLPSLGVLNPEQRDSLLRAVQKRFRWASSIAIILLIVSGLYNIREYYWEVAWGRGWQFLTVKIILAFVVFAISLCLTLPLKILNRIRARRSTWLAVALALSLVVILISAYLRRG